MPKKKVLELKLQKSVIALLEGGASGSWRKVTLAYPHSVVAQSRFGEHGKRPGAHDHELEDDDERVRHEGDTDVARVWLDVPSVVRVAVRVEAVADESSVERRRRRRPG